MDKTILKGLQKRLIDSVAIREGSMKKAIIGIAVVMMLSGCSNMSVSHFQQSEYSGVKGNKVTLIFIEPKMENADLIAILPVISGDKELQSVLANTCGVPAPDFTKMAAPLVGTVIATAGKLLFDMFMDNQVRQIEGLKKAARGAYSEKRLISGADLKRQSCALTVRYKEDEKDYGLVALVKLVKQSDDRSFVVEPAYVRAKNAVVVTEKPTEADKPATIGIAIGVSVKAITKQRSNLFGLQQVGEGVVSVPRLALGPHSQPVKCDAQSQCSSSDLIPYPETGKEVVSVAISVAEVGKISVDFDQSIAEATAIKEAIGPVLKDTIKDLIKD